MGNERKAASRQRQLRPINPILSGLAMAAIWGFMNIPAVQTWADVGEFCAKMMAIAAVCGGAVMLCIEVVTYGIKVIMIDRPRRLR